MALSLLTPDKIKDDKRDAQLKTQRRDIGLAEEENRLIVSINLTRDAVEDQKSELATELAKFKADTAQEKAEITGDIVKLKDQRKELLKPIDDIRKDAESKLEAAVKREEAVGIAENALISRETAVAERERKQKEEELALEVREGALKPRETAQNEREERLQAGFNSLSLAQTAHGAFVNSENERLDAERIKVVTDREINGMEAKKLADRAAKLDEQDRKIQSNYKALGLAMEEFARKQHASTSR